MEQEVQETDQPASIEWWHLVYLIFLLFTPFFDPGATVWHWVLAVATAAAFVPVYVAHGRGSPAVARRCIAITLAFFLIVAPFNPGAAVFTVYVAAMLGSLLPRRRVWSALVALTALLVIMFAATLGATELPLASLIPAYAPSSVFVWVVGMSSLSEADRIQQFHQLRVDRARAEHLATATERERIARDLHDLLGHTLTSVVVRAQLVQRVAPSDPERARDEGAAIEAAARETLETVRQTVSGWRTIDLDTELDAATNALATVNVSLEVTRDSALTFAPSVETALALSLREAVTNVVRHAGARHCRVWIGRRDGEVHLEVRDDGRGLSTAPSVATPAPERERAGTGLRGIQERIAALGGRVERHDGGGTVLLIAVPAELGAA